MKVVLKVSKYGQFLSSRPDGREAALAALAYQNDLQKNSEVELNFEDVIVLAPSWLSEFANTLKSKGIESIVYGPSENLSVQLSVKTVQDDEDSLKVHPWRLCPVGFHWVKTHPLRIPKSKKNPHGSITTRYAHCAHNPSGKDQLYPDEIHEIAKERFGDLKDRPCPLPLGFENGSKFDVLIAGWVQYWNSVLKPSEPLTPNLVKALIASESSFRETSLSRSKSSNRARGLMQITNSTRKIMGDEKGELKDHYLTLTQDDLKDPNLNICAGVRWLFHKRDLASRRLKRNATWVESAEEYKGDLEGILNKNEASKKDVQPFLDYLAKIEKCEP